MQSYIITGKDKEKIENYLKKLFSENSIGKIDREVVEAENSIGIAQIRSLQKTIFLTPVKSKIKATIIKNAHTLTVEAQNALLKLLEEPPSHTIIVLLANDMNSFLPTILSRCKIIEIKGTSSLPDKTHQQFASILVYLQSSGVGDKLKLAQDIAKNKEDILPWFENMILAARKTLIEKIISGEKADLSSLISHLSSFQKTYTLIKTTNANPRLILENLFLSL